jgi:hypothetical protein
MTFQVSDIFQFPGRQVIHGTDGVSSIQQLLGQKRADETGAAGYQHFLFQDLLLFI